MTTAIATKLFVIAAHPDDDVIGAGGTISHVARSGGQVSVAYLTDGSRSHPGSLSYSPEDVRDLREREAVEALAVFGVTSKPTFFRLPDSGLWTLSRQARSAAAHRLAGLIAAFGPDLILSPWRRDPHADHIVTSEIARDAAKIAGYEGDFATYEVWLPIRGESRDQPSPHEVRGVRLAIDSTGMDAKRRAILAHRSQTSDLIGDDPTHFRIDADMMARWVTPVERLFYEQMRDRRQFLAATGGPRGSN
jgi:LmbE family N-acetylglucosaminyl deacetylase